MRSKQNCKKIEKSPRKNNEGFALIEVMLSAALIATFGVAFQTLSIQSAKLSRLNQDKLKATMYLRELIEVSKDLEQTNWTINGGLNDPLCASPLPCHPEINTATNPDTWILVSGEESLNTDSYIRSLTISPVYRDQLNTVFPNNIVTSGGIYDPNTKKITATIIRKNISPPNTMTLETYVYLQ